jgi:hypothetical protein
MCVELANILFNIKLLSPSPSGSSTKFNSVSRLTDIYCTYIMGYYYYYYYYYYVNLSRKYFRLEMLFLL